MLLFLSFVVTVTVTNVNVIALDIKLSPYGLDKDKCEEQQTKSSLEEARDHCAADCAPAFYISRVDDATNEWTCYCCEEEGKWVKDLAIDGEENLDLTKKISYLKTVTEWDPSKGIEKCKGDREWLDPGALDFCYCDSEKACALDQHCKDSKCVNFDRFVPIFIYVVCAIVVLGFCVKCNWSSIKNMLGI